jgi:hypothetical protein
MSTFLKSPPKIYKEVTTYVNIDGERIEEGKFFVYEISKYKYIVDGKQRRVEYLGGKYVKSDKAIRSKCNITYFPNKKKMEYCIIDNFNMMIAPREYVRKLPIWKLKKKSKK